MGDIVNQGTRPYDRGKTALVLSAGAPNAPLTAGALHAAHEAGYRFPLIYASGGGIVVALVLLAPKGGDPLAALEGLVDKLGVEDEIYNLLPLGYKTFFKDGPFTAPFRAWSRQFKLADSAPKSPGLTALQKRFEDWVERQVLRGDRRKTAKYKRLYDDLIDLGTAVATPTLLSPMSKGLCQPFPLIEELVDFDALGRSESAIFIPAFNLKTHKIQQFSNRHESRAGLKPIDADAVRACLASPFIYPPVVIGGEPFIEGAYEEPYNEVAWTEKVNKGEINNLLLLDILGAPPMKPLLLREPTSLWDAYGLSILTPIVANAETTRETLPREVLDRVHVVELEFDIPPDMRITGWNRGNLQELFRIGRDAVTNYREEVWPANPA